jgi:hypothetical protein
MPRLKVSKTCTRLRKSSVTQLSHFRSLLQTPRNEKRDATGDKEPVFKLRSMCTRHAHFKMLAQRVLLGTKLRNSPS